MKKKREHRNPDVYRLVSSDKRILGRGSQEGLAELQSVLGGDIIHKKDLNGLRDEYDNR